MALLNGLTVDFPITLVLKSGVRVQPPGYAIDRLNHQATRSCSVIGALSAVILHLGCLFVVQSSPLLARSVLPFVLHCCHSLLHLLLDLHAILANLAPQRFLTFARRLYASFRGYIRPKAFVASSLTFHRLLIRLGKCTYFFDF